MSWRFEIRRVGFRFGTDNELAALHLVESEIESERRPGRAFQPLETYSAFARSLPSQFDDHVWLAGAEDGTPLGCSACWSNAAGDPSVMECYVYVRPSWRTRGVGSRLAMSVTDEARIEGRSGLIWSTYDSVPAGEAFSRRFGGRAARVNRISELQLAGVDWEMVHSWIDAGRRRAMRYSLDFWDGPFPPNMLDDAAQFHHIMNTAPRDSLEVADTVLQPQQVAEIDRHLAESGRQRWTIFVRGPDGRCVGGTEMTFETWEPTVGWQQNTAIHPHHRGQGLAKWVKASMLARIRHQRPAVDVVRTANAFSNEPMLAINSALGFKVVAVRTEWQRDLRDLDASLL